MADQAQQQKAMQAYIDAGGDLSALRSLGYPPAGANAELKWWNYKETVSLPMGTIDSFATTLQLFKGQVGSTLARNLTIPTTSDLVFNMHVVTAKIIFVLPDTTVTPVDAQYLEAAYEIFLNASQLYIQVSGKEYVQSCFEDWANIVRPNVLDGITGQGGNAPFAVGANQFNEHHHRCLLIDPAVYFPANGNVRIQYTANVNAWGGDVPNVAPVAPSTTLNLPAGLLAVKFQPIITFDFYGLQTTVTK